MALEQEIKGILVFGFTLILSLVGISIFILWNKTKNKGLLWFIPQLLMLILCLYFFVNLINNASSVSIAMISEENSLMMGLIGISWALSMIFMTIGLFVSLANIFIKQGD